MAVVPSKWKPQTPNRASWAKRYRQGASVAVIATDAGYGVDTVRNELHKRGVKMRPRGRKAVTYQEPMPMPPMTMSIPPARRPVPKRKAKKAAAPKVSLRGIPVALTETPPPYIEDGSPTDVPPSTQTPLDAWEQEILDHPNPPTADAAFDHEAEDNLRAQVEYGGVSPIWGPPRMTGYHIPMPDSGVVEISGHFPLTNEEFNHLLHVLMTMRPGLVRR